MGLYRQEGIVLNVETPSKGFQWKFKPHQWKNIIGW